MKLKEMISDYKEKTNLTNEEIANTFGVTKQTIGRWLSGEIVSLKDEQASKLSELLGYDVKPILNQQLPHLKKPILGVAKAGYDLFLDENYLGEEEVVMDDFRKGDYFLKIIGDSMIGSGILDGSLVYVKQTPQLNNGDIGVIQIGDEVTVKKVIYKPDMIILEATNPAVENRYFTSEDIKEYDVKILGKVLYCKTNF